MIPDLYPCPSFPGYSVSSDGRVFSHRRRGQKKGSAHGSEATIDPGYVYELSQVSGSKGYLQVSISKDGLARPIGVHRLVLDAFSGPCPSGCVSRHLDGDPKNNTPGNLAYGSHTDNAADRLDHGRYAIGEDHPNAKLTDRQAAEIKALRAYGYKVKAFAKRTASAYLWSRPLFMGSPEPISAPPRTSSTSLSTSTSS